MKNKIESLKQEIQDLKEELLDYKNTTDLMQESIEEYKEKLYKCYQDSGMRVIEALNMTVSQYCRKYHLQCCHICEDFGCCDNTNIKDNPKK